MATVTARRHWPAIVFAAAMLGCVPAPITPLDSYTTNGGRTLDCATFYAETNYAAWDWLAMGYDRQDALTKAIEGSHHRVAGGFFARNAQGGIVTAQRKPIPVEELRKAYRACAKGRD